MEQAFEGKGAWQLTLQLALATRYGAHPRVQKSQATLGALIIKGREHAYRVLPQAGAPAVLLDQRDDLVVGVKAGFGDVHPIYIFERDDKRMKAAVQTRLKGEIRAQAQALIGEILHDPGTKQYSEDAFAKEVLCRAVQKIGLTNDDFEKITIQRSLMLLDVTLKTVDALPRYFITFQPVERVKGEGDAWEPVRPPITEIDDDFEARLIYWRLGRAGEFWSTVGIVVSGVALVAVAWELGVVAFLVDLAGGTTAVLVSIGSLRTSCTFQSSSRARSSASAASWSPRSTAILGRSASAAPAQSARAWRRPSGASRCESSWLAGWRRSSWWARSAAQGPRR